MSSKTFRFGGVLGFGWNVMRSNFWFFAGVLIVLFLISLLGQIAGLVIKHYQDLIAPFWFFAMLGVAFIIKIMLLIGRIKIALSFCDSQKPSFSTLFNGFDCFWRFLVTGFFYILILGISSAVCILPFVFLSDAMSNPFFALLISFVIFILIVMLSIKFGLCFYFVVDKGLGPIKALKASSMATTGAKGLLFVFFILSGFINFLGYLCIIGAFATVPMVMVAMALVYRHLSEQTPELAELGISGPSTRPGAIAGGIHNTSGIRLDSAIQAVINSRADQNITSREVTQPTGGIQSVAGAQFSPATQSGTGVQLSQGVQLNPGVRSTQSVQPTQSIRPVPAVQGEEEKRRKSSLVFWLITLVIVSIALIAGIGYRLWSKLKVEVMVSPEVVAAMPKEVSLTGILYSEDNPTAMIDGKIVKEGDIVNGVEVVKIDRDEVEFEKDGVKWAQRAR